MFLVRWIRILLAFPLLTTARGAGMLRLPASAALASAGSRVSGRGADARAALIALQRHGGSEIARIKADQWMALCPSPEIAGFAGLIASDAGDAAGAAEFLRRGRELGDDTDGMLDILEYFVAARSDNAEAIDVVRRFESRRDLPPVLSKMLAVEKIWWNMLSGRFDEVRPLAERLLEVDDTMDAEMALWALAVRDGDDAAAERHLRQAGGEPDRRAHLQALGLGAIGRMEQSREIIDAIAQANPTQASHLRAKFDQMEVGRWT